MLRKVLCLLILTTSVAAHAGNFDFLPTSNGPEKEFQNLMNAGSFKPALLAWNSAHGQSAFGRSHSGNATLAYLLFQNGMQVSALDILINETHPRRMDSRLLSLWTTELKNSAWIQKGWIQTSGAWKRIYNNETETVKIKSSRDIKKAFRRADRKPKDAVNQKTRIWWQIATKAPLINQADSALKAIKMIRESGQTVLGVDQLDSAQARILFQKNETDEALRIFAKIPKSSSLWVESVEERAWAYLKEDDYDKAISETVTLLSPALAPLVGPESYYMANLASLKICDYPKIFKNSELFKKRHLDRLNGMQALAKSGTNEKFPELFGRLEKNGVSVEAAGPLVEWAPRSAYRDQRFVRFVETRRQLLNEVKKASALAGQGGVLGGAQSFERIADRSRQNAERLKQLAFQRARALADKSIAEYRQILNKMHIIEGEVIHRLAVDESLKGKRSQLAKVEKTGADVLVFPYKSDEVWFDELDSYKARVKDCPTLKGASL